jgi:hypothetical protein
MSQLPIRSAPSVPQPSSSRRGDPAGRLARLAVWPGSVAAAAVVICLPFLRSTYALADEGILLHGVARMARGEVLYRDIFELYPPVGFFIVRLWTLVLGHGFLAARLLSLATITALAVMTALACERAGAGRRLSAALTVAWLAMSQGGWTIVDHHWFTTLLIMVTLWSVLDHRPEAARRSAFVAGLALGAAVMTTPPRGVLAGLAVIGGHLVELRGRTEPGARRDLVRRLGLGVAGAAVVPVACLAWVTAQGALGAAVQDLIVFPATQYSGVQSLPWGKFAGLQDGLLVYAFPGALVLAAVAAWRGDRRGMTGGSGPTLVLFAVAGGLGCFPRPDIVHIAFAVPLALPLIGKGLSGIAAGLSLRIRRRATLLAAVACAPAGVALATLAFAAATAPVVPAWGVNFPLGVGGEPEVAADLATLPAGARIFYYPYLPLMPVLAGRVGVAPLDVFVPGYTTAAQYDATCRAVIRDAQWVVIDVPMTDPRNMRQQFPALGTVNPPAKARLERAIRQAFPDVRHHGRFELRRRGPDTSADPCA